MTQAHALLDEYFRFLRDRTILRPLGDWTEITTPFLDRHNDYIQIYLRADNGGFMLSDGGETLTDLEQSGCSLNSPKRRSVLQQVLLGYGVSENRGALQVHATRDNFPFRKHNFVQAILSVNDMFYLAAPTIESLFFESVQEWLDSNEVRHSSRVKFSGKSGFDHVFDFLIPKSRTASERIARAINHPNRDRAQNLILAWLDTRESRPENAEPLAILNDNEHPVSGNVVDALSNYGITPIPWSKREDFVERLAA